MLCLCFNKKTYILWIDKLTLQPWSHCKFQFHLIAPIPYNQFLVSQPGPVQGKYGSAWSFVSKVFQFKACLHPGSAVQFSVIQRKNASQFCVAKVDSRYLDDNMTQFKTKLQAAPFLPCVYQFIHGHHPSFSPQNPQNPQNS